jgi:hypothetical protein
MYAWSARGGAGAKSSSQQETRWGDQASGRKQERMVIMAIERGSKLVCPTSHYRY